jgi:hypothetical protein
MTAALIGISSGFLVILVFGFLRSFNKKLIYGLILSGIGFLYVGFVWADPQSVVINSIQAVVFVIIAYFGIKRNLYILAAGYFLHGAWDLIYPFFRDPKLIPPQYDLFCSTLDFVIGIYIILFKRLFLDKNNSQK